MGVDGNGRSTVWFFGFLGAGELAETYAWTIAAHIYIYGLETTKRIMLSVSDGTDN